MRRGFDRTHRIAALIQEALARMLLQDMNDERFRLVTVTGVTVSRDLSYAKVYVSVLADTEKSIKETVKALNNAARPLRYHLAKEIDVRVVPELKFIYDESILHGFHISGLIDSATKKEKK